MAEPKDQGAQPKKGRNSPSTNPPPTGGETQPKAQWLGVGDSETPIVTMHKDGKIVSNLSQEEQEKIRESYANSTNKMDPPQKMDTKLTENQMINIVNSISNSLGVNYTLGIQLIYMLYAFLKRGC